MFEFLNTIELDILTVTPCVFALSEITMKSTANSKKTTMMSIRLQYDARHIIITVYNMKQLSQITHYKTTLQGGCTSNNIHSFSVIIVAATATPMILPSIIKWLTMNTISHFQCHTRECRLFLNIESCSWLLFKKEFVFLSWLSLILCPILLYIQNIS